MCGIAGVFNKAPAGSLSAVVDRMMRRLTHRGPDGCGAWHSASGHAALGHTRLAIFDTSSAAAQPMCSDDGRYTITYNGAIYNVRALRQSLQSEGCEFRTASDTEVVLRAYQRHGAECVRHLQGMFAFVIWDDHERSAFLARDAFGIKPLYYAVSQEHLLFASELRALVASRLVPLDVDATALYEYFLTGSVPEPRTIVQHARMLPAGATACWRDGIWSMAPPQPWPATERASGNHAVERTRTALIESIARHFEGDAACGVLLSAGVDSSAILALAREAGREPVAAFSLSFPGHDHDEGDAAARVAAKFGATHHVLRVDSARAGQLLDRYAGAIDQPSIDGFNTFIAAGFAREHGVSVVLSGIGADELFGGYPSFWRVPKLERWHRVAARTGPLAAWGGAALEGVGAGGRARRIADLLQRPPSIESAYEAFRGIYTRAESKRLVRHFCNGAAPDAAGFTPAADAGHADRLDTISMLELTRYVRNQLLRDSDVMSMAWGVELRTPFLDRQLADVLWQVPSCSRVRPGKSLLMEAVPELPAWTRQSPKRCFQLPFDEWLRDGWRGMFDDIERGSPVRPGAWYRKWSVFAVQCSLNNLREARNG